MIVTFDDTAARAAFLNLLERERPDIRRACRVARTSPDVVVRVEDQGEDAQWIVAHLREFSGRSFANVTLSLFSAP